MRLRIGRNITLAAVRAMPTLGLAVMLAIGGAPAVASGTPAPAVVQAGGVALNADEDHDSMPGMDMPASDMPSEDSPAQDMPGMDMPAEDMPAPADEHAESVPRPRGLLIGSFVGINAAVLVAAAVLRRRTRAERDRPRNSRTSIATPR